MNRPTEPTVSEARGAASDSFGALGSQVEGILRSAEQAAQRRLDETRRLADVRLREAGDEADRIRSEAQHQAEPIRRQAEDDAGTIRRRAEADAEQIRRQAEDDARRTLEDAAARLDEADRLLGEAEARLAEGTFEPAEGPAANTTAKGIGDVGSGEITVSAHDGLRMLVAGKAQARRKLREVVDELSALIDELDDESDVVIDLSDGEPTVVVSPVRHGDDSEATDAGPAAGAETSDRSPATSEPPLEAEPSGTDVPETGADEAGTAGDPAVVPNQEVQVTRSGERLNVAIRSVVHRVVADVFSPSKPRSPS
jgi:vacuolar-type H+-ATPase subunit H